MGRSLLAPGWGEVLLGLAEFDGEGAQGDAERAVVGPGRKQAMAC